MPWSDKILIVELGGGRAEVRYRDWVVPITYKDRNGRRKLIEMAKWAIRQKARQIKS